MKYDVCPSHTLPLPAFEIMASKAGYANVTRNTYGDEGVAALCAIPFPPTPRIVDSVIAGDGRKGKYHVLDFGHSCWNKVVGSGRQKRQEPMIDLLRKAGLALLTACFRNATDPRCVARRMR